MGAASGGDADMTAAERIEPGVAQEFQEEFELD
jgi:hypothetical protein